VVVHGADPVQRHEATGRSSPAASPHTCDATALSMVLPSLMNSNILGNRSAMTQGVGVVGRGEPGEVDPTPADREGRTAAPAVSPGHDSRRGNGPYTSTSPTGCGGGVIYRCRNLFVLPPSQVVLRNITASTTTSPEILKVKRSGELNGSRFSEVLWPPAKALPGRGCGQFSRQHSFPEAAVRRVWPGRLPATDSSSPPAPCLEFTPIKNRSCESLMWVMVSYWS